MKKRKRVDYFQREKNFLHFRCTSSFGFRSVKHFTLRDLDLVSCFGDERFIGTRTRLNHNKKVAKKQIELGLRKRTCFFFFSIHSRKEKEQEKKKLEKKIQRKEDVIQNTKISKNTPKQKRKSNTNFPYAFFSVTNSAKTPFAFVGSSKAFRCSIRESNSKQILRIERKVKSRKSGEAIRIDSRHRCTSKTLTKKKKEEVFLSILFRRKKNIEGICQNKLFCCFLFRKKGGKRRRGFPFQCSSKKIHFREHKKPIC